LEKGYRSIGCAPCTIAIGVNDDERAGRWSGRSKIECGLHTDMFQHSDISKLQNDFHLDISSMERRRVPRE
jgi:phosphoadenosine phosphosulfate reductase